MWPKEVVIYTDGASRGNPGPAAIGVHVEDSSGELVDEIGETLGHQTNNVAEYTAVVRALEVAIEKGVETVTLRSDSELLIKQLKGEYRVKNEGLKPLYMSVQKSLGQLKDYKLEHVRREFNKPADRLANDALDGLL